MDVYRFEIMLSEMLGEIIGELSGEFILVNENISENEIKRETDKIHPFPFRE